MSKRKQKPRGPGPRQGTAVIWPSGAEARYGIKPVTRWRWEGAGKLPPRDVFVGGRSGWRPETLDQFERDHRNGEAA